MVTRIGLFEAKTNFGKFAKRASLGEIIEITDRGRPLARLVSASAGESSPDKFTPEIFVNLARLVSASAGESPRETLQAAFEHFKQLREKAVLNPPGLPEVTLKELVEEGRKW